MGIIFEQEKLFFSLITSGTWQHSQAQVPEGKKQFNKKIFLTL